MKITIIHKPGCQTCETAIREFRGDGHEMELHGDLGEIADPGRRADMICDLISAGGDKDKLPQVFVEDRFIPWQPKQQKGE